MKFFPLPVAVHLFQVPVRLAFTWGGILRVVDGRCLWELQALVVIVFQLRGDDNVRPSTSRQCGGMSVCVADSYTYGIEVLGAR